MLYQRRTFTCPASSRTSQFKWDMAFLTPKEVQKKYSLPKSIYEKAASKEQGPSFEEFVSDGVK